MTTKKPVIIVSVSLSMVVRNFFSTRVMTLMRESFEVVVLSTPKVAETIRRLGYDKDITLEVIDVGPEPGLWKALRHFKKKVHMESRQSATEAIWEKYHHRPLYQRVGGKVIKWLINLVNPLKLQGLLENIETAVTKDRSLSAIFEKYQPTMSLLCITATQHDEIFVRNCRAFNVPVVYMVMSWDHLSAKVVLHLDFKLILVWNEHTRQETLRTYPWFNASQVKVVGIPHFDSYALKPEVTREQWCERYGLDPARRTLLFSTMPQVRHDQQHLVIKTLLDEIKPGGRLPADLQILIKCHPLDNFAGYAEVITGRPAGLHGTSFKGKNPKENWEPSDSELTDSRNALYFCDVNINIFSTVTIEAAFFNKPIISLAFDPLPIPPGRVPCREYYNWDHFKHIVDKNATIMTESYDQLFDAINKSLSNPKYKSAERQVLVDTYMGCTVGTGSQHMVDELVSFSRQLKG